MAIEFHVKIIRDDNAPSDLCFEASSEDAAGTGHIFAGHGGNPYDALSDLIDNFRDAELYRPDEG